MKRETVDHDDHVSRRMTDEEKMGGFEDHICSPTTDEERNGWSWWPWFPQNDRWRIKMGGFDDHICSPITDEERNGWSWWSCFSLNDRWRKKWVVLMVIFPAQLQMKKQTVDHDGHFSRWMIDEERIGWFWWPYLQPNYSWRKKLFIMILFLPNDKWRKKWVVFMAIFAVQLQMKK